MVTRNGISDHIGAPADGRLGLLLIQDERRLVNERRLMDLSGVVDRGTRRIGERIVVPQPVIPAHR
jgi:hypothetical protein